MEALKNTSMMVILAGVFYGAYQMFVSDPNAWKTAGSTPETAQIAGGEVAIDQPLSQNLAASPGQNPASAWGNRSEFDPQHLIAQNPNPPNYGQQNLAPQNLGGQNVTGANQIGPPNPAPLVGGDPNFSNQIPAQSAPIDSVPANFHANSQTIPAPAFSAPAFPTPAFPAPASVSQGFPASANRPLPNDSVQQIGFAQAASRAPASSPALPSMDTRGSGSDRTASDLLPIQNSTASLDPPNLGAAPASFVSAPASTAPASTAPAAAGPASTAALKSAMDAAALDIQKGDWAVALKTLTPWSEQNLGDQDRQQLMEWLDHLAGEVIFSGHHLLAPAYVVQAGDTLQTVAERYQVAPDLIANINFYGMAVRPESPLQAGTQIKVVPGPINARANLNTGELTLFVGDLYAGRYRFESGESSPIETLQAQVTVASTAGLPAMDEQRVRHEPMSAENPFGRYCLVAGNQVVLHSPAQKPESGCLIFSEQAMVELMSILNTQSTIEVVR